MNGEKLTQDHPTRAGSITRFAGRGFRRIINTSLVVLAIIIAGCTLINSVPNITLLYIPDPTPLTGSTHQFYVVVDDVDSDVVTVSWTVTAGQLSSARGDSVLWTAPLTLQDVTVTAVADDRINTEKDTARYTLSVVNGAPIITSFSSSKPYVIMGNEVTLSVTAEDPDGETITFDFATLQPINAGEITADPPGAKTATATWRAPTATESLFSSVYNIIVTVSDELGFFTTDTIDVLVYTEYNTIWVVDSGHKSVRKYTSRGDFILASPYDFKYPVAVASNYDNIYGCYVADKDGDSVVKLDAVGEEVAIFASLPQVEDIAFHKDSETLWVLTRGDSSLTIFLRGEKIKTVAGFSQPNTIEINQNTGDVWISDKGKQAIYQLNANDFETNPLPDTLTALNTTIFSTGLNIPAGMTVRNELGATLYIADKNDNEIEILTDVSGTGNYTWGTTITTFTSPQKVTATDGDLLWVITPNLVQYISESDLGGTPTTLVSYFFQDPVVMTPEPLTGEMWIGDNATTQVVKIAPGTPDVVSATISGFSRIEDIVINQ